jgi:2-keto-4-pentenoate hydratase/2-oxohepta-3-ene-1,7-dioic acid hydratase in catechol pathway
VAGMDLSNVELVLKKNGQIVQQGNTSHMIFRIEYLIAYLSTFFTLHPGDIILTGTPEGVGPIDKGDKLSFSASFSETVTIVFK